MTHIKKEIDKDQLITALIYIADDLESTDANVTVNLPDKPVIGLPQYLSFIATMIDMKLPDDWKQEMEYELGEGVREDD